MERGFLPLTPGNSSEKSMRRSGHEWDVKFNFYLRRWRVKTGKKGKSEKRLRVAFVSRWEKVF